MEINLVTISKLSSEIIDKDVIRVEHVHYPVFRDLTDCIYDKYPALGQSGDYKLYWRYSENVFLQITDYISYVTAIRLMVNKIVYVLIDDFVGYWDDNIAFLEELDRIEEEERKERERDIYDVRRVLSHRRMREINSNMSITSMSTMEENVRTDSEVISYACRREPKTISYLTDLYEKINLIQDLKKGYPKIQTELHTVRDVVFQKRVLKDPKGQNSKKDTKALRDKKSDKGDKKDKKKKKGGKKK